MKVHAWPTSSQVLVTLSIVHSIIFKLKTDSKHLTRTMNAEKSVNTCVIYLYTYSIEVSQLITSISVSDCVCASSSRTICMHTNTNIFACITSHPIVCQDFKWCWALLIHTHYGERKTKLSFPDISSAESSIVTYLLSCFHEFSTFKVNNCDNSTTTW